MRPARLVGLLAVLVACACPARAAAACDLVAAPDGSDGGAGTVADPLRTPQRLADRLGPGETGCLRAGTYRLRASQKQIVRFGSGGRPGRPLTLRSYPGERATLAGGAFVTAEADHVTITDLRFDDPTSYRSNQAMTVEVNATDTILDGLEITNGARKTCVVLGAAGYGRAVDTVIRDSYLHDCGDPGNGLIDHAIYLADAEGARLLGNRIVDTGGYAVHMYPRARDTLVRDNVIVRNGGGVIFAGEGDSASSANLVTRNFIGQSSQRPDISSYWGGRVGFGNVARSNCVTSEVGVIGNGFRSVDNVASLSCGSTITAATLAVARRLLRR